MNISGGQRRKIVLARALLRNTDVYIFDESTSNFDENSEMLFLEIAKKYLHDKMIIFISHNDVFNDYVDKIYNLEGGSLTLC